MHEVLVNRLGGLSLPRKSVVRLTDRPDMTLDVYRGRKTTIQQKKDRKISFTTAKLVTLLEILCKMPNSDTFRNFAIFWLATSSTFMLTPITFHLKANVV